VNEKIKPEADLREKETNKAFLDYTRISSLLFEFHVYISFGSNFIAM
jgi:hypothetical protein